MSGSKKILWLCAVVVLIGFTACLETPGGNNSETITPGVEGAIYDGIILLAEDIEHPTLDVVQVVVKDLYHEMLVSVNLDFWLRRRIVFQHEDESVWLYEPPDGRVREDDVLAIIPFEDEELAINRRLAAVRLEQFDRDFTQSRLEREVAIEAARRNAENANSGEAEAAHIAVQLLETELQIFIRDMRARREPLYNALDSINQTLAGMNIYAPFDGTIRETHVVTARTGEVTYVIYVVDETSFVFIINVSALARRSIPDGIPIDALFNFGSVITISSEEHIQDEDGEYVPRLVFDIVKTSDPMAVHGSMEIGLIAMPVDIDGFLQTIYDMELSVIDISNMRFVSFINVPFGTNSMVVPRRSVRVGDGGTNFVYVYIDGVMHRRYVVTGIIFDMYQQIIAGLEEDSMVVVFR